MNTVLLKKIHKLGVAYKEYNRNPRRVGKMLVTQLWSCSAIAISRQGIRNSFSSTEVHAFLCFSVSLLVFF